MANYRINIEDIPDLSDKLKLITNLNNIIMYGPVKSNSMLAYKSLEAGYLNPELDFSYNLNVCQNAKIGNNLDVFNDLNVMSTGFINQLFVYNLQNFQFQKVFTGAIPLSNLNSNTNPASIYIYIDQYYNIYPAYVTNTSVNYLDPVSLTSINDNNKLYLRLFVYHRPLQDYYLNSVLSQ